MISDNILSSVRIRRLSKFIKLLAILIQNSRKLCRNVVGELSFTLTCVFLDQYLTCIEHNNIFEQKNLHCTVQYKRDIFGR